MATSEVPAIAVIADAHYHDINSDYDGAASTFNGKQFTLRSWADTRQSSRVFNESGTALKTALTGIAQQGIRHVVLLGDYTDDGQIEATARLVALLRHYHEQYGIAFYATPGNHDVYGPVGKHQSTRFASTPGNTTLVTSDSSVASSESNSAILTQKMYCEGAPQGLLPMAEFGYFRQAEYHHWETPFGQCDTVESRLYEAHSGDKLVTHQLMDASYLVEPMRGIWLLMIDANVFEPRNGYTDVSRKKAFHDSSDAGWNSVLRNKPFLLEWIRDVCSRASQLNKRLLAFSHYPALDPFNDQHNHEFRLFGNTEILRRRPAAPVAEALTGAGLRVHFSGHLHVNGTSHSTRSSGQLTNIAVPSLVAFPPCYKVIYPGSDNCRIDTVSITSMPYDPVLRDYYREECIATGEPPDSAFECSHYGDFHYQRMHARVFHHYLVKDWPAEITRHVGVTTALDLACLLLSMRHTHQPGNFGNLSTDKPLLADLASIAALHDVTVDALATCSMMTLIVDWYCLRQAGRLPTGIIDAEHLRLYSFLQQEFGDLSMISADTSAAYLSIFVGLFQFPDAQFAPGSTCSETVALQGTDTEHMLDH